MQAPPPLAGSVLMKPPPIVSPATEPLRSAISIASLPGACEVCNWVPLTAALVTLGWMSETLFGHTSAIAPEESPELTLLRKLVIVAPPPEPKVPPPELPLLLLLDREEREDGVVEEDPREELVESATSFQHHLPFSFAS